jgi:hypothetical protein
METIIRINGSQGIGHVHSDLLYIQKKAPEPKNIKLPVYKALIRSIITYACPTWEFAADTH